MFRYSRIGKLAPPDGHVFQLTATFFKLGRDIIKTSNPQGGTNLDPWGMI